MADCTYAAVRNIFLLKKCDYKPDNKKPYGSHLVDNSWGKTYKGWPTSIEIHMGYKRNNLRNDMVERGRNSLSMSTRLTTAASPTRTGLGSINMNTKLEDLRSASPNGRTLGGSPVKQREYTQSPIRIRVP